MTPPGFELKLRRAEKHLQDLQIAGRDWIDGHRETVKQKYDPKRPNYIVVTATAQAPPDDVFAVVIGECLHNMRSALDLLAFALAAAHTKPLTDDIAQSSEFPIFNDSMRFHTRHSRGPRVGLPTPGSGFHKIRGTNPKAQTLIEGMQPYHDGAAFADHPLWRLHELDRINKHRLVHTAIAHSTGLLFDVAASTNFVLAPGVIEVYDVIVEKNTEIARIPFSKPVRNRKMHVEVRPALHVAFAPHTGVADKESVPVVLGGILDHIRTEVVANLQPYL